jgi:hypothetical protein
VNHNENTCEIKKNPRECFFGKRTDIKIVSLEWDQEEDLMMVDTQKKYYQSKGKGGPPKTNFSPNSSSQ